MNMTIMKATTMKNELTTVDFHGAQLLALGGATPGDTMVAMKPIVEGMGLDWSSQHAKIKEHPVLSTCIGLIAIQVPGDTQIREHVFIRWNRLNFWLATINANRVGWSIRPTVIAYQTDCADVLFEHFFGKAISHPVAHATDLSRDSRSAVGGIVQRVTAKSFNEIQSTVTYLQTKLVAVETLLRNVIDGYDPTQIRAHGWLLMIDILKAEGVTEKNRRSLSTSGSAKLRRWCLKHNRNHSVRNSIETGRYLYHIDAVTDWLAVEGRALIRAHKDRMAGQGALKLLAGGK